MGAKVIAAAESIQNKARVVVKLAKQFKFHELAPHAADLRVLLEKANKLSGANPDIDTDEFEYPFERQSEYLRGTKPKKVLVKIEEAAPSLACACDPVKCQCITTDEEVCGMDGVQCGFCDAKIRVGAPLFISDLLGEKMCAVCARILNEKVRLKESVAYAVINLIEDACTEAGEPFFQFEEAHKLVVEAQERLQEFRNIQRAKVATR